MGHSKVISCSSCRCASEQHRGINYGRVLCLQSYERHNSIQEKRRLWSDDEIYMIHRQMDFLSMHNKGYPQVDKVVQSEANESEQPSGIELLCEPGLPDGWEQCLDLETGECFYIDKSCGKRTKTDPRPILVEANKNIHALMPSWCSHSPLLDQDRANCYHQDSNCFHHDSTIVSSGMHILVAGMDCSWESDLDVEKFRNMSKVG